MCQICEDFKEFDHAMDAVIARELPKMLAPSKDLDILWGARKEQP